MTHKQATQLADKELEKSLQFLNEGKLSKYVESQKQVDYLNGLAEALKK